MDDWIALFVLWFLIAECVALLFIRR